MSRLISLFQSLSLDEVKQFGQFFQSPYYNATPKARALYKYLKKTHPECPFETKNKQELFVKIFDGEAYNTRKMNNLTASLSSILQDFLLLKHLKKGTTVRHKALSEVYKKRKLSKRSMQQLLGLEKKFQEQPSPDTFRYYEELKLYHELYFHFETKRTKSRRGQDYGYLKEALKNLRLFHTHLWLRYICEMNFRESNTKEFELTKEENDHIENLIHKYHAPLLEIYLLLYKVLRQADGNTYKRLKTATYSYIDNYNPQEINSLLTFLVNCQTIALRKGDTNALSESFDLYKYGLSKKIYLTEAGYFSISHFINITVLASELGETEWLAAFIDNNKATVEESERENLVYLCRAYLHFARHQYDDTILIASRVRYAAPNYALTCWTLEIRAYYMMRQEYDYWENILKNFQAYLRRRHEIASTTKTANRNFITFIRELYRANHLKTHTREELLAKLETTQNIVCKRWLEKQIRKIK